MRRIVVPQPNENPVEDIQISFYEFDGNGNIALKTTKIEIPLGLGRYAMAAMSKGWLDLFDGEIRKALGTTGDTEVFEKETDALLKEFQNHLQTVVENRKKVAAEQTKLHAVPNEVEKELPN